MENSVSRSPFGSNNLNEPNSTTSPFSGNPEGSLELMRVDFDDNIFAKKTDDRLKTPLPAPVTAEEETPRPKNRKRINDFDGNILTKNTGRAGVLRGGSKSKAKIKFTKLTFVGTVKHFEQCLRGIIRDFKNGEFDVSNFNKIFPPLHKSRTLRASVEKLSRLNKIAQELITQKIPYGEAQEHYKDLADSLSLATNIQADLRKKIG